jgi:hypothetical protein
MKNNKTTAPSINLPLPESKLRGPLTKVEKRFVASVVERWDAWGFADADEDIIYDLKSEAWDRKLNRLERAIVDAFEKAWNARVDAISEWRDRYAAYEAAEVAREEADPGYCRGFLAESARENADATARENRFAAGSLDYYICCIGSLDGLVYV